MKCEIWANTEERYHWRYFRLNLSCRSVWVWAIRSLATFKRIPNEHKWTPSFERNAFHKRNLSCLSACNFWMISGEIARWMHVPDIFDFLLLNGCVGLFFVWYKFEKEKFRFNIYHEYIWKFVSNGTNTGLELNAFFYLYA